MTNGDLHNFEEDSIVSKSVDNVNRLKKALMNNSNIAVLFFQFRGKFTQI